MQNCELIGLSEWKLEQTEPMTLQDFKLRNESVTAIKLILLCCPAHMWNQVKCRQELGINQINSKISQ